MKDFRPQFTTIKGISERRRLPRLGKIRLGIKATSQKTGKEYPKEVDYFVCPPEVQAVYGENPKELDIMLPVNDLGIVLPTAYKWYGRSFGVKCVGDGETAMRSYGEEGMKEVDCPCKHLKSEENTKGECNRIAHFLFILPQVSMGGVYQIDTGSINSIIDIQSGLDYTATLVASVTGEYRFAMIPLKLKRVKRETHGSGRKETHYTLMVESAVDITQLNKLSLNTRQIPVEVETPRLTEAVDAEYEDEEDDESDDSPETSDDSPPTEESNQLDDTPYKEPQKPSQEASSSTSDGEDVKFAELSKQDMLLELTRIHQEDGVPGDVWDKIKGNIIGSQGMTYVTQDDLIQFHAAINKWMEDYGNDKS